MGTSGCPPFELKPLRWYQPTERSSVRVTLHIIETDTLMLTEIFVFGSNRAGRHGKGSALEARKNHGAIYGQGEGIQGNSYGIPTKDHQIRTLSLDQIKIHVDKFIQFAKNNPQMTFNVVRIGCMLAGYTDQQIAPLFKEAPNNCNLPEGWRNFTG